MSTHVKTMEETQADRELKDINTAIIWRQREVEKIVQEIDMLKAKREDVIKWQQGMQNEAENMLKGTASMSNMQESKLAPTHFR
jgi:hypothetical protein